MNDLGGQCAHKQDLIANFNRQSPWDFDSANAMNLGTSDLYRALLSSQVLLAHNLPAHSTWSPSVTKIDIAFALEPTV